MSVVIETTIGEITVDLYHNERPTTCWNFIKLCKMKYYNCNLIFSVERNFIAQTGDPTGTGKGGCSIFQMTHGDKAQYYEGEKMPILKHKSMGTLSMASCGNGLFGSQFFVTLCDDLDSLDEEHLVFGQMVEGWDVLEKLNQTLIDETKRPYQDILVTHTVVLSDPFPDPKELRFPCESPPPPASLFSSNYIAADEDLGKDELKSLVEMQEEIEAKEAEARATILEMVGDLPSADTAPPENVLFVCKLNPVTTSEDLEVIFSRFGRIQSAEVIRDHVTNNSLQYAFIAFYDKRACEDAYFKMDNVLIDDRRIHVDFSQSVSKVKWKGKGRGVEYFDDQGRKTSQHKGQWFERDATRQRPTDRGSPYRNFPRRRSPQRNERRSEALPKFARQRSSSPHHKREHSSSESEQRLKLKSKKKRKDIIKKLKKDLKKKKKKKDSAKKKKKKEKRAKSKHKHRKPKSSSSEDSSSSSSSSSSSE